jgi:hypothetical protein
MRFQMEKNIYIYTNIFSNGREAHCVSTADITKKAAGSVGQCIE